jgi:putative effector of murein hydrolase LrgA (UPF0299 family)
MRYADPDSIVVGIVQDIDPELVLFFVPIVVGDVNEPFLSDNWAVNVLVEMYVPVTVKGSVNS